nr:hypothetical protein FVER53263_10557 [Fusarium verticillioides]
MAEAAGTAIGIISFGLQLYTGLSEYLDAVKGRDEDLLQARNNAKTLQCSLKAIEDAMSKVNGDHAIAQDAVEECKSSCQAELKALHQLLRDLKGEAIGPAGPVSKVRSSIHKWSYPFKKKSINRLEERLKSANNVLKTALSTLQLAILNDQSTAILALQKTVDVIHMRTENASIVTTEQGIDLSQSRQHSRSNSQSMSMSAESKLDEILTHLRDAGTAQSQIARLVAYPQDLQILCNAVSNVSSAQRPPPELPALQPVSSDSRLSIGTPGFCRCVKRQNLQRSAVRLGLVFYETELTETTHHTPDCPLSQIKTPTQRTRSVLGVSIPNILGILTTAIGISVSLTTGAGGFSIGQNITWAATVDERSSPSFKIIKTLCTLRIWTEPTLGNEQYQVLAKSCVRRLHHCYINRQASPVDINSAGESVLDTLTSGMKGDSWRKGGDGVALMFQSLASFDVPVLYDRGGDLRFLSLVLESNWLLKTNMLPETMSALLSRCGESTRHDYRSVNGFDKYPQRRRILKEFPQIAESYKARYYPYRLYDNLLPLSVADTAFSEVLGDDCRCHCSLQGCTPFIKFLEGLGCRRRFPRTSFTLTEGIRSFVASAQALIAGENAGQSWMPRAILRYATFCALGLRHTCCKHLNGGSRYNMDSDEIDEIHEEDSVTLQQLEDLVTYFGNGYGSMTTLDKFLKEVWLPKMEEVYREIVSYNMTEEELKKAEACGVKLAIADKPVLGCEPPQVIDCNTKVDVDEPERMTDDAPIGLEGWMKRLDEIAIDPDRPVFVNPAGSSTIAGGQTGV